MKRERENDDVDHVGEADNILTGSVISIQKTPGSSRSYCWDLFSNFNVVSCTSFNSSFD